MSPARPALLAGNTSRLHNYKSQHNIMATSGQSKRSVGEHSFGYSLDHAQPLKLINQDYRWKPSNGIFFSSSPSDSDLYRRSVSKENDSFSNARHISTSARNASRNNALTDGNHSFPRQAKPKPMHSLLSVWEESEGAKHSPSKSKSKAVPPGTVAPSNDLAKTAIGGKHIVNPLKTLILRKARLLHSKVDAPRRKTTTEDINEKLREQDSGPRSDDSTTDKPPSPFPPWLQTKMVEVLNPTNQEIGLITNEQRNRIQNRRVSVNMKTARESSHRYDKDKETEPHYRWSTNAIEQEQGRLSNNDLDKTIYWSYRFYRNDSKQAPSVRVCTTKSAADDAISTLLEEPVVGFDLEWISNSSVSDGIKKNICLIQIASQGCILLIHLACFKGSTIIELLPTNLSRLLQDEKIIKAGVNIRADCTRLERHLGVKTSGIFELSHLYKLVHFSQGGPDQIRFINKKPVPLACQVEEYLGLPLFKGEVRTGSWSAPLNKRQIEYAASDAYASYRLYQVLEEERLRLNPIPPRPMFAELNQPILVGTGQTIAEFCSEHDINLRSGDRSSIEGIIAEPKNKITRARDFMNEVTGKPEEERVPATAKAREAVSNPANTTVASNMDMLEADAWAKAKYEERVSSDGFSQKYFPKSCFKAYYLWHHRQMDIKGISSIWRDPPLKPLTVALYISKAVRKGNLPHNQDRLSLVEELIPNYLKQRLAGIGWAKAKRDKESNESTLLSK